MSITIGLLMHYLDYILSDVIAEISTSFTLDRVICQTRICSYYKYTVIHFIFFFFAKNKQVILKKVFIMHGLYRLNKHTANIEVTHC